MIHLDRINNTLRQRKQESKMKAMTKLGFKRVRTNQGAFYEVYQIPPNEIQPTLAITDNETVDSQADTSWHEQPLPF